MKSLFVLLLAVICAVNTFAAIDTPIIDDHLKILGSQAQDIAISTKSRYNLPDNSAVAPKGALYRRNLRCKVNSTRTPATPQCKVVQIQMVARHGTRNPSAKDLKKFTDFQQKFKTVVPTNPQFAFLANFSLPCNESAAGLLTKQGEIDHMTLAQRVKSRYPDLVADPKAISWAATNVSRAIASGESFITGLFIGTVADDAKKSLEANVLPKDRDADLRPFDSCQTYLDAKAVQKNQTQPDDVFQELKFPTIATRLSKELGVANLTVKDLSNMFKLCAFENTLQGKDDGFCSLFTADEFKLNDFAEDLGYNADSGYGISVNEQLACSLLTTVSNNMDSVVNNNQTLKAVFKFAHAETIGPIITTLGLFNDNANGGINPNMTDAEISNRKFKAREFSPFTGNVMFELQQCGPNDFKVRVLSDERPVLVPGCDGETCSIAKFKEALKGKIGCDFDGTFCKNKKRTVGGAATFKTLDQLPPAERQEGTGGNSEA